MVGSIHISAPALPVLYPKQHAAIYEPKRYSVIEASTKSGKTVGCLVWLFGLGWNGGGGRSYSWMAPINKSAMKYGYSGMVGLLEQWDYGRRFWCEKKSEQAIEVLRGKRVHCKFWFFGSEDPDNVYGDETWGAVVDEASRVKKESWHALRTTLTYTRGPVRIIGNVKSKSTWMYELGSKARAGSALYGYHKITALDAVAAGIFPQEELDDARETLPGDVFQRDYMAVPMDAGAAFFRSETVEQQRRLFGRDPERMRYDWEAKRFVPDPGGSWYCWPGTAGAIRGLHGPDGRREGSDDRKDQIPSSGKGGAGCAVFHEPVSIGRKGVERLFSGDADYVFGIDISYGVAGSNSVIAVLEKDTGRLVAEYVDPNISPEDLADLATAVGKNVFSGRSGQAYICWEANGPGEGWFRNLLRNDYHRIYFQRREGSRGERRGRRYGWHSTRVTKMDRLGDLRSALTHTPRNPRRLQIPSHQGLDEMMRYIYMDDGSVGPDSQADLVSGARANHGDRVIAYMVALMGLYELEKAVQQRQSVLKPDSLAKMFGMDKVLDVERLAG